MPTDSDRPTPSPDHFPADPSAQRWDAFISYRRGDAQTISRWLWDRLRRYRLPSDVLDAIAPEARELHSRGPRIYLDLAFERSSDDFRRRKLFPALDHSDRLIVVSTPSCFESVLDAAGNEQPNFLVQEIDRFLDGNEPLGRARPVDVVLGPGAPPIRFPGRLAERSYWAPADLREFTWWQQWRRDLRLDAGITKLVASLYDVREPQLPALYREEASRQNRLWAQIPSGVGCVAIILGAVAWFAWTQRDRAIAERDRALTNESLFLSRASEQETDKGDAMTGALIALSRG